MKVNKFMINSSNDQYMSPMKLDVFATGDRLEKGSAVLLQVVSPFTPHN